ncbi:MAG: S8 family serine peptidase [Deltaproteobacteria bacterium]|jgi:MYXO-CTERM domain-containing protein|nr:S8 family serine peptidase [Deltaproteobacteria bacterium]MBW2531635.1 S8 family serine peptidase [Deltaproteobacteria bacterium]
MGKMTGWMGMLAFGATMALAGTASAKPGSELPKITAFQDGAHRIEARRLGAPSVDALGRRLTPLELRYAHLSQPVPAAVDRTAIVWLDESFGDDRTRAAKALAGLGVRVVRPLMPSIGLWLVEDLGDADGLRVANRLVAAAAPTRGLRRATPNLYLYTKSYAEPFEPNDPEFAGQWYFDKLNMTEVWGITQGAPSSSIIINDTGCDLDHPDLVSKLDPGLDVIDDDDDPSYVPGQEGASHGTQCAGITAAETDNEEGIAGGCPECRLRCVRLLSSLPHPESDTVDAFEFALQVDAAVVSNSWGYVSPIPAPLAIAESINNLFANGRGGMGAMVLFAAGNDSRELGVEEIEGLAGVLCIGAVTHLDEKTSFTNYGKPVDLVAYIGTVTTDIDGYTSSFGGTSSACPVAAGIAGLLTSAAPERTSAELYQILIETARPAPLALPDEFGHDATYGYGIIDPLAALQDGLGLTGEDPDAGTTTPAADSDDEGGCTVSAGRHPGRVGGMALLLLGLIYGRRRRPIRD